VSWWSGVTASRQRPGLTEVGAMMSLPFLLFACGLGAAWLRQRAAAMGFWVAGLVVLLVLFRMNMTDVLNIAL
jgi:hypothetical protein